MACSTCGKKRKTAQPPTQMITAAQTVDAVRMEYIGHNSGPINWRCPSGHAYAGSKNAARFADVFPEDVDFLESTRRWRKVLRVTTITPAIATAVETVVSAPEVAITEEVTAPVEIKKPGRKKKAEA